MFKPEVLDGALTPEQRAKGFSLKEDDHCLYLLYRGKREAVFSATGATIETIRVTADRIASIKAKTE